MRQSASQPSQIIVFLGPTMPGDEAARLCPATFLPPASQGDIFAAVVERQPAAIGLVDGVFQDQPAVRHKEILLALFRGVAVYGAASMGAIRAAELDRYGMVGVGLIYRWYRRWPLAPDDAVAVTLTPPELGAQAMSEALIDLRIALRRAARAADVPRDFVRRLEAGAASLFYPQRTLARVLADAAKSSTPSERVMLDRLGGVVERIAPMQKRRDAEALLHRLDYDRRKCRFSVPDPRPHFEVTEAFVTDLLHAGFSEEVLREALAEF